MSQGGEMRRWRSFRVDQNGRAYDERYHAMTDAEMRAHARLNPLQQFVQMDDDVAAPLAAAEQRVIEAAGEVVREGDHAWREHGGDPRSLGTHMQYYVLPAISRLRRMLDALRAARGEASDA